jgi:hypothetical protein
LEERINQNLPTLLERLTPAERQGAILEVQLLEDTPIQTRTPQAMLEEVRKVLAVQAKLDNPSTQEYHCVDDSRL